MKRRYGAGTVFQSADGRWTAQWEMPKAEGRRRRRQLRADTEAAAWKRMRDAQRREPNSNSSPRPPAGSVGAFLERWLADVVTLSRRERTLVGYRAIVRRTPAGLLAMDLSDPTLGHELQGALLALAVRGRPANPRTVLHYAACLRTAFAYGVRKGLMDRNPAADLDLPAVPRVERIPLTAAQLRTLLHATDPNEGGRGRTDLGVPVSNPGGHSQPQRESNGPISPGPDTLHALWTTAAWTGMRQGELLALRWQDVNLERASLVVRGSLTRLPGPNGTRHVITDPKTERSRRTVPLVPEVVEALRTLRKAQLAATKPAGYLDQGLVFCSTAGYPLDAANVSRWFGNALKRAKLPAVRFHDMRHGAASLLIEAGVDLATVSALLGHSNIATTVDVYGHLTEGHKVAAMARLAGVG